MRAAVPPAPPAVGLAAAADALQSPPRLSAYQMVATRDTGRLSGPRGGKGTGWDFEGLGPLVSVLVAVHLAALIFWIISLVRGGLGAKTKKADLKQH